MQLVQGRGQIKTAKLSRRSMSGPRWEERMGDPSPSGKTFDFTLLPPRAQLNLWALGLSADTGHVGILFKPNQFITSLGYDYGGAITASRAATMGGTVTLGFDP